MADYRPVDERRRDRYHEISRQAFAPEGGPIPEWPADQAWPPELSDPRGLVVDDELVATCKLYYLEATIRGEWATVGGLGAVATPPEHRGKGYAAELLRHALEEYRESGVDVVALWPFSARFYRDLGWGTALRFAQADLPPEQLPGLDAGGTGTIRQLDVEDWERLRTVEEAVAERFDLTLRRSETWWRERTLAAWPDDSAPFVYGLERPGDGGDRAGEESGNGDLAGFAVLDVEEGEDGRRLRVGNLAGVDHEADLALLDFLGNFDTQVETVRLYGPLAGTIQELIADPGEATVEQKQGPMVRLTDVRRGLAALEWPTDAAGSLVLDVSDPLLDRNDDRFEIGLADGDATVDPVSHDTEPGATVDVATLSRLATGAIDVERAERLDGLDLRTDEARSRLAAAFEPRDVFLREFF